ncbi:MAG: hypothetical protein K8R40_12710 [Anaerolineaceae bacterium]|nr:hypothetical protein [Anaerolineaceae bacterium]
MGKMLVTLVRRRIPRAATAIMALALPKRGLKTPEAKTLVGEFSVADISCLWHLRWL